MYQYFNRSTVHGQWLTHGWTMVSHLFVLVSLQLMPRLCVLRGGRNCLPRRSMQLSKCNWHLINTDLSCLYLSVLKLRSSLPVSKDCIPNNLRYLGRRGCCDMQQCTSTVQWCAAGVLWFTHKCYTYNFRAAYFLMILVLFQGNRSTVTMVTPNTGLHSRCKHQVFKV